MAKRPRKRLRKTHHKVRPDFRQDPRPEVELTEATIGDLRRELFPHFTHEPGDPVSDGVRDEIDAELARAIQRLVVEGKIKPAPGTEGYDVERIAKLVSAQGIGPGALARSEERLAETERGLAHAAQTGDAYQLSDGRWIGLSDSFLDGVAEKDPNDLYVIHTELAAAAGLGDALAAKALGMVTAAAERAGVIRDVSMTVAGDDPELVGAMIDKQTGKLVGAAPNTPAAKLSMEEAARRLGVEAETDPDQKFRAAHRITGDQFSDPQTREVLDRIKAVPHADDFIALWPDGEVYEDAVQMYTGLPGIKISYVGLATLSGQLEAYDLTCGIEPGVLRTYVDPKVMHHIISAWRIQREDRTIVRLGLMVQSRRGVSKPGLHDVLPETWEALRGEGPTVPTGAFLTASDDWEDFTALPSDVRVHASDRPVWAGARAFDRVWTRCGLWAAFGHRSIDTGEDPLELLASEGWEPGIRYSGEGLIGYGMSTLAALVKATEVLVEPDQINAMPDFDSMEEATDYAERLRLPFDSVFLDMEGPARSCVVVPTGGLSKLIIRGAHVARMIEGDEDSPLAVMPYGAFVSDGDVDGDQTYNPLGLFLFGTPATTPGAERSPGVWGVSSVLTDGYVHRGLIADPNLVRTPLTGGGTHEGPNGPVWDVTINPDPEEVEPSRCQAHTTLSAEVEPDYQRLAISVAGITGGALAALKALFLMDMSNVEVIDGRAAGQVSRQVARQADRRGQTIALAVHVQTSSKRYMHSNGGGSGEPGSLEYSHRFRVRGHVKHYPVGTRMADADPRKVKPCPRCGNCRRIWTPPYIKGPDDRPLILKSLVLDRD